MQFVDLLLNNVAEDVETDVVIIGGGPSGLTLAREFAGTRIRVVILESGGLVEEPQLTKLNAVESVGEPTREKQRLKRREFHGALCPSWSPYAQPYGVRCRVFGGCSGVWAGKSAAFDEHDFQERSWVANSGWPIRRGELAPYIERAADVLNLGPNVYDERLWELIGIEPPSPQLNREVFRSFFWQFARSRVDNLDVMRFGRDFASLEAPNVKVFLHATAVSVDTQDSGLAFKSVEVKTLAGHRLRVRARAAILAASAIENARLLLASNQVHPKGLGNQYDVVGRYLMDHPSARIGRIRVEDCGIFARRFGFYGVRQGRRSFMFMHGLALSPEMQKQEQLLNCSLYMLEDRAPDDPWDALKRLMRGTSQSAGADLLAVAGSPSLLAKGIGIKFLRSHLVPGLIKQKIVEGVILLSPNFAVREFQSRGLPHKLNGLTIDAITEQIPDPQSRITLSPNKDALGVPMAVVNWQIHDEERRTLLRSGELLAAEVARAGLPSPVLEDWVTHGQAGDSDIIDMAHTLGTTRMSDDPKSGVVDKNCQVHGVEGLYVAGGSVFSTSGHANPTLMMLALAVRLADHLKCRLAA